jgi:hypothetical protein
MIVDAIVGLVANIFGAVLGVVGVALGPVLAQVPNLSPFVTMYQQLNVGLPLDTLLVVCGIFLGIKAAAITWATIKQVAQLLPFL